MALRRSSGFTRYALSIQYHGASHLGFSYQGLDGENCVLPDGRVDLRGVRSVEGRIREALCCLAGRDNYENFQGSSRTDRGVHALRNTCHVDLRPRKGRWAEEGQANSNANGPDSPPEQICASAESWDPLVVKKGLNYFLSRQRHCDQTKTRRAKRKRLTGRSPSHDLRVLSVDRAPHFAPNKFYTGRPECDQPEYIDWNVRFTATERTYAYRILNMTMGKNEMYYGLPFESDRAWRIIHDGELGNGLDVGAMNEAARLLVGRHDYTSFRGKMCERFSPIVTVNDVDIKVQINYEPLSLGIQRSLSTRDSNVNLITIIVQGKSFLYRQVRNMVGCLAEVGQRKILPVDVERILNARDRREAPPMAPAHGLFLVNVKHGDYIF